MNKTMDRKSLILINPRCHQGRGWKRWLSVRTEVEQALNHSSAEVLLEPGVELTSVLPTLLDTGHYGTVISAGGDGSLHHLVNVLLKSCAAKLDNLTVGAVGLGSSNDFLKPFGGRIKNIPTRIDLRSAIRHDVGLVRYCDENRQHREKYFIVNASFGVTALANWNFNNPGTLLKFLKASSTRAAIAYTALSTIARSKNFDCHLKYHNNQSHVSVSNINIIKRPFISGSFRYRHSITPDDGRLGLFICRDMNRIDLLKIMSQLGKGKFDLGEKTISETIDLFDLVAAQPVVLECDGETARANNVSISIVPKAINVLSC